MLQSLPEHQLSELNRKLIQYQMSEEEYSKKALPLAEASFNECEKSRLIFKTLRLFELQPLTRDFYPPLRQFLIEITDSVPVLCE